MSGSKWEGPCCPLCGEPAALGIEVRGVYDGVLIWECAYSHQWARFPEGRLHDRAVGLITDWAMGGQGGQ